jgi:hypothetical protein
VQFLRGANWFRAVRRRWSGEHIFENIVLKGVDMELVNIRSLDMNTEVDLSNFDTCF